MYSLFENKDKDYKTKVEKYIGCAIVVILIIRFLYLIIHIMIPEALRVPLGSFDFQWDSAKLLSMRMDPYKQTLYKYYKDGEQYSQYYGSVAANQFPSVLCLLLPYALFEPLQAKTAWLVSNALFALVMCIALSSSVFKNISIMEKMIWNLLWLCSTPLLTTIGNGQHLLFSFSFFIAALVLSEKGEKTNSCSGSKFAMGGNRKNWFIVAAGVCLAVSYFKYTVTFVTVLYFIRRKWYSQVAISVFIHLVLTGFVSIWLWENPLTMIRESLIISAQTGLDGGYDIMAFLGNGIGYRCCAIVLTLSIMLIVFAGEQIDSYKLLMLLIVFSLIIVYHRGYDYFIMILPMYFFWKRLNGNDGYHIIHKGFLFSLIIAIWFILFYDTVVNHIGLSFSEHPVLFDIISCYGLYGSFIYLTVVNMPVTHPLIKCH